MTHKQTEEINCKLYIFFNVISIIFVTLCCENCDYFVNNDSAYNTVAVVK